MKFGSVPVDAAVGAILAHGVAVPGGRLRKGSLVGENEVAALRAAGLRDVVVARRDPGDLGEDAAAARIAAALVPDPAAQGLRIGKAATGRVNLYATGPGVIAIDVDAVTALNRVDPMITLATVPEWHRVDAGSMVATVKIIAYAVAESDVVRGETVGQSALRLCPPVYRRACLIETEVPEIQHGPKGRAAMAGRLDRLGVSLDLRVTVAHAVDALAHTIAEVTADVILILTASATSDPDDVAPAAVRAAGGRVERFGMPVDPGNLLFLGALGDRPVIGLPGCARSPALNGADWVLERVICGVPVSHDDVARMGVGGLLKEIPTRPRPREAR